MRRARAAVALAALSVAAAAGCSRTSLLLDIHNDPSAPNPSSLDVAAFGRGRLKLAGTPIPLGGAMLPAPIGFDSLDPLPPNFRVLVSGLDRTGAIVSQAAARVPLAAGVENRATLTLTAGRLPDCNGDGVPDAIQLCPGFNPNDDCVPPDGAAGCLADGGGVDLAPPDGNLPHRCPTPNIFCEDFEDWPATMANWAHTVTAPSAYSIDPMASAPPAGGSSSAHFTTAFQAGVTKSEADLRHSIPQTLSGLTAVRLYLNIPFSSDGDYYLWLLNGKGSEGVLLGTILNGGHMSWLVKNDTGLQQISTDTPPTNRWTCVELDVDQQPTGTLKLYVDDTLVMTVGGDTRVTNTSGDPMQQGIDRVALGYVTAVNATQEAWVDDVVLATQHLGCE